MSRTCLFIVAFWFAGVTAFSQTDFFKSIKARSITLGASRHSASLSDPGYSDFIESSRFGYLYDDPGNYDWHGSQKDKSFDLLMNFRMKDTTRYRHEFLVGIKKVRQKVDWLAGEGPEYIRYSGRAELMKAVIGYRFYALKRNWIRFSVGSQVDFGFTVSSFTKESSWDGTYEYFGHKRGQAGMEFPALLEFRILKGPYLQFGPAYGFSYLTQDGVGQVAFTKNFILAFRVDI